MKKTILVVVSLISLHFLTAQNLVEGIEPIDDILVCDGSVDCVDLTAVVEEVLATDADYTVESIPFDPVPVNVPVPLNIDDSYSGIINMPFRFCYFGNFTNQLVIGANCDISFDTSLAGGFDPWQFDEACPDPNLPSGGVFGPYTDVDPSVPNSGGITYGVTGTAPFRAFVISYEDLPMFSGACNDLLLSSQIVLHETTNFIDVYILNKPNCPTWNDGNGIIGIQNVGGTVGIAAPGRNTTDSPWEAQNEGWRFKPNGTPVPFVFEWLDADGVAITSDLMTNVCPEGSEDYKARVTYTLPCPSIDNVKVYEEDVNVSIYDLSADLGSDITLCNGDPVVLNAGVAIGDGSETYTWFKDGVELTGETGSTLTVSESGMYSVDIAVGTACTNALAVNVTIGVTPEFIPEDDFLKCEDDVVTLDATPTNVGVNDVTYQWFLDGVAISGETSATLDVVDEGDYSVDIDNDGCMDTKEVTISFYANSKCVITQGISPDSTVGLNDCLDLEWLNDQETINRVEVFNRYGTKVFSKMNYINEWCGQTDGGDQLPTGTYFYVIYTQSKDPRTGWVYVNRDAN